MNWLFDIKYCRGALLCYDDWQIDLDEQICSRINQSIATCLHGVIKGQSGDKGPRGRNVLQSVMYNQCINNMYNICCLLCFAFGATVDHLVFYSVCCHHAQYYWLIDWYKMICTGITIRQALPLTWVYCCSVSNVFYHVFMWVQTVCNM